MQDLEKQLIEEQRKNAQLEQDARNVSSQFMAVSPAAAPVSAARPQGTRSAVAQRWREFDRDEEEEEDADEEEDGGSDTEPEDDDK